MAFGSARTVLRAGLLTGSIIRLRGEGPNHIYRLTARAARLHFYRLKLLLLTELSAKREFVQYRPPYLSVNVALTEYVDDATILRTLAWEDLAWVFAETGKLHVQYLEMILKPLPVECMPLLIEGFWKLGLHPDVLPYTGKWVVKLADPTETKEFCTRLDRLLPCGTYAPLQKKIKSFAIVGSREMRNVLRPICEELLTNKFVFEPFIVKNIPEFITKIYTQKRVCTFGAPLDVYLNISRDFGHRLLVFDSRLAPRDAELIVHQSEPGTCYAILKSYLKRVL